MAISTSRSSAQARSSTGGRAGARDGVELRHAGGGEIGEVARIGVVHADAQRKDLRLVQIASAAAFSASASIPAKVSSILRIAAPAMSA
jgi:hypothetical protein